MHAHTPLLIAECWSPHSRYHSSNTGLPSHHYCLLPQARELRLAASKDGESLEVLAAGDVFREKWVEDAVMRLLQRRMGAGVH
jgi:hypothetical protein